MNLPLPASSPTAMLRRGHGFLPVFTFGLVRVVRWSRVLLVAAGSAGLGAVVGFEASRTDRPAEALAVVLDRGVLAFGLPVVTLLLAGEGFAFETHARTLVYHLVRPVSRVTVFLARFLSGWVPSALASLALLLAVVLASGVAFPAHAFPGLAATAALATLTLGAIYYTLGALFRNGLVAGLVYTFVVETLVSSVPGAMQTFSVMFQVRSLAHHATAGVLPSAPAAEGTSILPGATLVADATPTGAAVALLLVAAIVLAVGAWRTARRDFALKD